LRDVDLELVQRARNGDESAFCELVDRRSGALFGLALSLVGNIPDAEDVLQETFSGAYRGLRKFEQRSSVKTWLTRILVRQAAKTRRSRHMRKMISLDRLSETSAAFLKNPKAAPSTAQLDIRMDVLAMLDTLSPPHREVLVLRELKGMSYTEMASILDIPRGTVESRLFRARAQLRERLKEYLP